MTKLTTEKAECEVCKAAEMLGGDWICPTHWVMPSSGWVDENAKPIKDDSKKPNEPRDIKVPTSQDDAK